MPSLLEYAATPSVQWVLLWTILALIALLLLLRKPRTLVLASAKTGRLEISRHALHRLLETCCEQLSGVASARARVHRSGGKFRTYLRLKVRPEAKLDAIQGYLVEEISSIYQENLGLKDEVGRIDVEIVGVVQTADSFSAR
ncbi:MAG TPA: hypothetical protein VFT72_08945 [Opitutaceae bacterium]|nr:hypothetical protein [Opitutaceae bacterium]